MQKMAALLRRRGLSVTMQRLQVYRSLLEDRTHPDAERIHRRVRRALPTIALGTVYKALDTLKELGAIMEVDAPRSATRYEAADDPHHHLICERCGEIVDLHERRLSRLRPSGRAASGFAISSCTVQFRGRCRRCRGAASGRNQTRRR
jgi:Fe2+ or Zn2+ uptake regulation protein